MRLRGWPGSRWGMPWEAATVVVAARGSLRATAHSIKEPAGGASSQPSSWPLGGKRPELPHPGPSTLWGHGIHPVQPFAWNNLLEVSTAPPHASHPRDCPCTPPLGTFRVLILLEAA